MATAPKSNSAYLAMDRGLWQDVRRGKARGFSQAPAKCARRLLHGMEREQGYLYPHDFPNHWAQQQYLPDSLVGTVYYEYGPNKLEQAAKRYWQEIKKP